MELPCRQDSPAAERQQTLRCLLALPTTCFLMPMKLQIKSSRRKGVKARRSNCCRAYNELGLSCTEPVLY